MWQGLTCQLAILSEVLYGFSQFLQASRYYQISNSLYPLLTLNEYIMHFCGYICIVNSSSVLSLINPYPANVEKMVSS